MDFLIENATVANEGTLMKRPVFIHDGRFAEVPADTSRAECIDAEGCYLLPGVIDSHVHFRDAGSQENVSATFESESRAAVSGGVTSVIDMPNTTPPTLTLHDLDRKAEMALRCSAVNFGFMLGATNDNVEQLLSTDITRYAAVKLFLGSSTGNLLLSDPEKLDVLFRECQKLIVAHCEEEAVVQNNLRNYRMECAGTERETAELHPLIRSSEACYLSSYKAVERARTYNTRLHIAHVSTATELNLFSNQPLSEKRITAEVTPNHLWFDDRDYATLGNLIKCNPSIKTNDDRLGLWAGLYDGLIDTIGSDHAPHPLESKKRRYFDAPSGIPSVQHTLRMMTEPFFNDCATSSERMELVNTWLPVVVNKMCHAPALLFGLVDRGFIKPGYWADLVLIRPSEGEMVTRESLRYRCGWSPLEGKVLHTEIVATFVNGTLAYRQGTLFPVIGKPLEYCK